MDYKTITEQPFRTIKTVLRSEINIILRVVLQGDKFSSSDMLVHGSV